MLNLHSSKVTAHRSDLNKQTLSLRKHSHFFEKIKMANNIEKRNFTAAFISTMNEQQLKHVVEHLTAKLDEMKTVSQENWKLSNQIDIYQLVEGENRFLKKEVEELRKQLQIRKDFSKGWKEEREYFSEREEQLNQVTKERDILRKELVNYKHECFALRTKSRDLKVALSRQEKESMLKIHVLELEVEKFQKEKSIWESDAFRAKSHRGELAQKNKALLKEQKRCSDLEEKLERATKEPDSSPPPNIPVKMYLDKPSDLVKVYKNSPEFLFTKLVTKTQQLTTKRRQLEKKDHIINEKERKCEELKHSMSQMLPPETSELIRERQWVIREQSKKIKGLTGEVNMFKMKAEDYKNENQKLVDKAAATKKLYLKEKRQNMDLRKAFNESGVKHLPEDKSGETLLPSISDVLHEQDHTKMQTLNTSPVHLPPISRKPEVKSVHTRAPTATKKVIFKPEHKSVLPPITKKR